MKRLLPFLLLLFAFDTIAQDYACIIPTDTSYFINADGYLRGIRIDATSWVGADTIYYPFKTARYFTAAFPGTAFDTSRGCWLGTRIDKQPDGIYKFHSFWLDTVFINTRAMPGDSWNFYNDYTSRRYLATVISIDTMTIKGALDSVKKIQITAYLGSTVNFSDSVHGFELLLSKNHGFASIFDLYMFPYFSPAGVTYPDVFSEQIGAITHDHYIFKQVEFHVPTLKEIYDFHIGDVFVTRSGSWNFAGNYTSTRYDSIISKTVLNPSQTVYNSYNKTRTRTEHTSYGYSISETYGEGPGGFLADTSKAFLLANMPEEAPDGQTVWHYRPNDTTTCTHGSFYSNNYIIPFEGCESHFSFKIGFPQLSLITHGTPSTPWWEECPTHFTELLFSKKNNIPCGNRVNVIPIRVTDPDITRFTIYPNPATKTLNLQNSEANSQVVITDFTGRALISFECSAKETSIDISQLAPGPYIIRVNDERQTFIKR